MFVLSLVLFWLISVAIIEIATMGSPFVATDPAEFIVAAVACHVVAATVFLDSCMAFRTKFGILMNPLGSNLVRIGYVEPLLFVFACDRVMCNFATSPAHTSTAFASVSYTHLTLPTTPYV